MFRTFTLRQMLTVPYVALVMVASMVIGGLSYVTGRDAVDTLSDYLLTETVGRISQAIERHVSGSGAVLETAFPTGIDAPDKLGGAVNELRARFWLATSMHRDPHNYVYYGDRNGHFLGLWRHSESEAELRLRLDANQPRSILRFSGISGKLEKPRLEESIFDPRLRPWYIAGHSAQQHTWTSIYVDFKTLELVGTRARRVNGANGEFQGVIATDLSLKRLDTFLRQLKLSKNGFAFIVEPDGNLIAASRGPHLKRGSDNKNERLNAQASDDPLIAATYQSVRALMAQTDSATVPKTSVFQTADGQSIQVGYARVQDDAGLDWIIAVAVPRKDFLSGITSNLKTTALLAVLVAGLIVVTGYGIMGIVTRDLRHLIQVTRDVGNGIIDVNINRLRTKELGELATSFSNMQERLLTDRLTGLANREAFLRHVEEKFLTKRRTLDQHGFALLFIDLNGFKNINDSFGHDAGDQVLRIVSLRMKTALRTDDFLARFAGDEFLVLLDEIGSRKAAEALREMLESKLKEPIALDTPNGVSTAFAGASIGMAMYPDDGRDVDTLIKKADADMYTRKHAADSKQPGTTQT